ncbi:hypothetical protein BCV70DRAFT_20063 [Testicularia cyperi]|uniref:Uncharacterized protein n=1 Tax=Testicularia cyperi TaxID=1882483 RepID=A0A317Y208_9BASI|nr:hypothetical protein BCV70DRAFT_20063 [Testicularia cyperi]
MRSAILAVRCGWRGLWCGTTSLGWAGRVARISPSHGGLPLLSCSRLHSASKSERLFSFAVDVDIVVFVLVMAERGRNGRKTLSQERGGQDSTRLDSTRAELS